MAQNTSKTVSKLLAGGPSQLTVYFVFKNVSESHGPDNRGHLPARMRNNISFFVTLQRT